MKINTHGNSFSTETCMEDFVCEKCGCEFSAIEDEYYIDYGGADENVSLASIRAFITDYIVCSCPECHKIIKKTRKRRNELFNLSYSGTCAPLNSDTSEACPRIVVEGDLQEIDDGRKD